MCVCYRMPPIQFRTEILKTIKGNDYENFPLYLLGYALKLLCTHLSSSSENNTSGIKVYNNIKQS